jgi:hypothetical protein
LAKRHKRFGSVNSFTVPVFGFTEFYAIDPISFGIIFCVSSKLFSFHLTYLFIIKMIMNTLANKSYLAFVKIKKKHNVVSYTYF